MKKIIKNKVYDTDTAKLICFRQTRTLGLAQLYQKKTGHYFIYYKTIFNSETITPVTEQQAADFAVDTMPPKDYAARFGAGEDNEMITATFRMRKSTHTALKKLAVDNNISMSEMLDRLIKSHV